MLPLSSHLPSASQELLLGIFSLYLQNFKWFLESSLTFGFTHCSGTSGLHLPTALRNLTSCPVLSCAPVPKFIMGSPSPSLLSEPRGAEVPGVMTLLPVPQSQEGCVGCRCAAGTDASTHSLTLCRQQHSPCVLGSGHCVDVWQFWICSIHRMLFNWAYFR